MNNRRNLASYRLYALYSDALPRPLRNAALQRAIELLDLQPGKHVLIPGTGTGLDLRYIS
mgnify:CR=1 FL=1